MIDTGSQLSILDHDLVKELDLNYEKSIKKLKTIDSSNTREGYTCKPIVTFIDEEIETSFFSLPNFAFSVNMPNLASINNLMNKNKFVLSSYFPSYEGNTLKISGILGTDNLHLLGSFEVVYSKANFMKLNDGYIPFGNLKLYYSSNDKKLRSKKDSNLENLSYLAMNPVNSYYSPLSSVFEDSCVEQGLDNLFALDSIGIPSEKFCSYDEDEIRKFEGSVELRDGSYYVDLPWKADLIDRVPSNFKLAKLISKKVHNKNCKDAIDSEYTKVFSEQLNMGIIEEIPFGFNPDDHIWIPHRAVVKRDPLVSTKVRPVFNCSLKTGDSPSLNEAAFPGTDLMNSLFDLLQYLRTNNSVLLADITKAFLMIKLKQKTDCNRFSFVLYKDGKYKYYRYKSIIFGFISSPFILNFIIKFHAKSIENKYLNNTITTKFYVDNLIITSNSATEAVESQKNLSDIMNEGGFKLRDWLSNNDEVIARFFSHRG